MCAKNSQSKNYTNFCQMFPKAQNKSTKYFLPIKCTKIYFYQVSVFYYTESLPKYPMSNKLKNHASA